MYFMVGFLQRYYFWKRGKYPAEGICLAEKNQNPKARPKEISKENIDFRGESPVQNRKSGKNGVHINSGIANWAKTPGLAPQW
jgi:hypothetical protein